MADKRHRSYGSQVAFIDLLFNTSWFCFLICVPPPINQVQKIDAEIVAEFIIKIIGPTFLHDIDLMRDPETMLDLNQRRWTYEFKQR